MCLSLFVTKTAQVASIIDELVDWSAGLRFISEKILERHASGTVFIGTHKII